MFLKSKIFRVVSLCLLTLSLTVFAFADTIRLKDGSIIKGKIVSFGNGQFVIVVGEGARRRQLNFFADEIESITFTSSSVKTTDVANMPPKPEVIKTSPTYTKTSDGKNTIIKVGSAPKTSGQETITAKKTAPPKTTKSPAISSTKPQPISIQAKVLADNTANGWTNSGWVVRKGQKIRILSNGRISIGNGRYSSPNGISTLPDPQKLIKDKPTGGLIAVIGDDNNDFIFIGSSKEFVAERDGALFLGVNEGVLTDNSGSFNVTIEIDPNIVK
ncbi:MAG: hypothetical protein HKN25_17670 [Pyrinomonadaceae bacterium]|nr:hypothetical protein [Pyrinomonadaceae bacterium]